MRLLVDENAQSQLLIQLLVAAGFDVKTAASAGLNGRRDEDVLAFAVKEGRALLTRDCSDFVALVKSGAPHTGLLLIYEDKDLKKCMSHDDIVRSIARVSAAAIDLHTTWIILNQWRE